MRRKWTEHLKKRKLTEESKEGKAAIIDYVLNNNDVRFYFSMMSIDIKEEEHSSELLYAILYSCGWQ